MNTITTTKTLEVYGPYRDGDGRVRAVTCTQQKRWAATLGARLPTPGEFDAMWEQADVRHVIMPRSPVTSPHDSEHDKLAPFLDAGLVVAGKTWVNDGSGMPTNYGMLVEFAETKVDPRDGIRKWRGIKVYPTTVDAYAVQPPGHSHGAGYADYSQLGYCVRETGAPVAVTDPPETHPSLTTRGDRDRDGDGPVRRMQLWLLSLGYELPKYGADGDHGDETQAALDAWQADQMPATEPAPALSFGERAVAFSRAELQRGRLETTGHNAGPRIADYFAPATRLVNGVERPIGISSGNWCAVGACYAEQQVLRPDEKLERPFRCSGIEMKWDASVIGRWRPAGGDYVPVVGDVVITDREGAGGWERHVSRVETAPDAAGTFRTIDANKGDRWRLIRRQLTDGDLDGFIVVESG